jgi:hypothetical protein
MTTTRTPSRGGFGFLPRLLAAVAVILLPVALTLGWLGIVLGAPLVAVGLAAASPGLAALHALERSGLRYHLALGFAVGAAFAVAWAGIVATSNTDPHDIKALTLRAAAIFGLLGGGFGTWCGLIWWAFFGRKPARVTN